MTAWPEPRRLSLRTLLARAAAWLVEPIAPLSDPLAPRPGRPSGRALDQAPPRPDPSGDPDWAPPRPDPSGDPDWAPPVPPRAAEPVRLDLDPPRPVVAILGLGPGAGTSTIARAVAARLAAFDPERAAVLHTADPPHGAPATAAASRLARSVAAAGCETPRAVGRLCVVAAAEPLAPLAAFRPAPIVADLAYGDPADGAIALADHVVLVASADVEPALAGAVATSLRENRVSTSTVLNRIAGDPPPDLAHALLVPDSRLAAQLTLTCREPRGAIAAVAAELAERSLAEVWR